MELFDYVPPVLKIVTDSVTKTVSSPPSFFEDCRMFGYLYIITFFYSSVSSLDEFWNNLFFGQWIV
jgi:hypothetical protein